MKYLVLVGDGMGDLPMAELDGKTPLEAAATPAMDDLARRGVLYNVQTVPPGMAPGSDVANLSLLGYRPAEFYTGRAPLEAASMGISLAPDEIAFRCNLVTLESDDGKVRMVDYSAGHISTDEAHALIAALNDSLADSDARFHAGVSYRHLLVTRADLSGLATEPPHDHTGSDVTSFWDQYLARPFFARLVTEAGRILASHPVNRRRVEAGGKPANAIWLWGEGRTPSMPTLRELYGLDGALVSAVDLLKGIAVCAGLEVMQVEGATGYLDTNCQGKVDAALDAIRRRDFVFVHVEAPDEASHHGLLREKMQAIEMFDARIVKPLIDGMRALDTPYRVLVAMDHYTPLSIKTHDPRAVPVVLYDSRWDRVHEELAYSERHAARHGDYLASGADLFAALLGKK